MLRDSHDEYYRLRFTLSKSRNIFYLNLSQISYNFTLFFVGKILHDICRDPSLSQVRLGEIWLDLYPPPLSGQPPKLSISAHLSKLKFHGNSLQPKGY